MRPAHHAPDKVQGAVDVVSIKYKSISEKFCHFL